MSEDKIPPPAYIPPAANYDGDVVEMGKDQQPQKFGQVPGQNQIALAFIDEFGNPVALDANGNQIPVMMVDQFGNPVQPTPEQMIAMANQDPAYFQKKKDP
jgi:hypothetical protein